MDTIFFLFYRLLVTFDLFNIFPLWYLFSYGPRESLRIGVLKVHSSSQIIYQILLFFLSFDAFYFYFSLSLSVWVQECLGTMKCHEMESNWTWLHARMASPLPHLEYFYGSVHVLYYFNKTWELCLKMKITMFYSTVSGRVSYIQHCNIIFCLPEYLLWELF